MSTSLLETTRQYLTPEVIDRLATFTGESPAATTKALGGAAPAILAGMLNSTQDANGLTQLVNLFQQGKFDGSMLNNLPAAYSGSSMDGLMKMGGPLLGSLLGARAASLTELIANHAGVKKSSAMSLLSAAAPLVMSVMGRQLMSRGGISAGALKDVLVSQRSAISAAVPAGFGKTLGIGELGGLAAGVTQASTSADGSGPLRKLLPILIAGVAALLLFVLLRSCGGSPAVTTPPRDTTTTMAPAPSAGLAPASDTTTRAR